MADKREMIEAFKELDHNKDGFIVYDELEFVLLTHGFTAQDIRGLINGVDTNFDGKLSLDEFIRCFEICQK